MNRLFPIVVVLVCCCGVLAQDVKPVWELGVNALDPALTKGRIEVVEGVVKLDGTASFVIPKDALGEQKDYTIEFELRLPPGFEPLPRLEGAINLISNMDDGNNAGLSLRYCPPEYNRGGGVHNQFEIKINGYDTGRFSGLAGNDFTRFTVVAKDRALMIYRNGTLWTMTGEVKPSALPLTLGEVLPKPLPVPYELRHVKVYHQAVPPTDDEPDAKMMRNISGEGYSMQRVDIKDPTLPRILVVGDSISGGYRGFITEHFKDKAYVDYWVGSGWFDWTVKGDDFPVLRAWSGVLANGPYDVVSWNSMTLHMWSFKAPERCLMENYPGQMTRVVEHLRKTAPDTKFIWIRCTPYTASVEGQPTVIDHKKSERVAMFNTVTDGIMNRYGIPLVDLYALCEKHPETALKDGIHWGEAGSRLMATEIAQEIEKHLADEAGGRTTGESPHQGRP